MTNHSPEDKFFEPGVGNTPLARIALEDVRDAFKGAYFRGVPNIIDPKAYQTGMRHRDLGLGQRLLEFDVWSDEEGTKRSRHLRIEIGEQDGRQPVDMHDFVLDESGEFYEAVLTEQDEPAEGEVVDDPSTGSTGSPQAGSGPGGKEEK